MVVGRRSFPFGLRPIFRGELLNFGRVRVFHGLFVKMLWLLYMGTKICMNKYNKTPATAAKGCDPRVNDVHDGQISR